MNVVIPNGTVYLSGIDKYSKESEYGHFEEGVLVTINDKNYLFLCDPADGYRSYGVVREVEEKPKFTFPPQPLIASNTRFAIPEESDYEREFEYLVLTNTKGQVVFKIGTDYTDDYYPQAIWEYHPELLPINQK